MDRLERTISIAELFDYMRKEDLVIAPRQLVEQEQLKEKIMRKKWITMKEIADSGIWGVGKVTVKAIVKDQVDQDAVNKTHAPFKIHRSEVERIAKNRGIL